MTGVLSRIGRAIMDIFLKIWYKDKKLFVIILAGLVLLPIASVMGYQEELNHSKYHNSALVFMLWVLLFAGLYYKQINRSSSRSRRNSSYSPNANSRYRETIRNLKNDQRELTRKQQEEMKRVMSNLTKLESKMTSIMPKPIKTEQEQNSFHKSANETDLQDNFSRFTPREMEELTGKLFERMGYSVEVTKQSGDFGIDVWATNKDMKIGIQVKKWKENVGFDDVSKTLGSNLGKANKYILISTDSFFTKQALEWQREHSHMIELWDTNRFRKELRDNGQIT